MTYGSTKNDISAHKLILSQSKQRFRKSEPSHYENLEALNCFDFHI